MKKLAFALLGCASLASTALAGHPVRDYKSDKGGPAEPCFKDHELQLDLFGLYGWSTQGSHGDGFGGGLGVNYFFTQTLGLGVDGAVRDAGNDGSNNSQLWNFSASLIGRFPLDLGGLCIAPYVLGGGGYQVDGSSAGTFHAGGGLEWRANSSWGVFTEGRYIWAGNDDQVQARLGFRIVF